MPRFDWNPSERERLFLSERNLCQCPTCGRMHKPLDFEKPPVDTGAVMLRATAIGLAPKLGALLDASLGTERFAELQNLLSDNRAAITRILEWIARGAHKFCNCAVPQKAECERLEFPSGCYYAIDELKRLQELESNYQLQLAVFLGRELQKNDETPPDHATKAG